MGQRQGTGALALAEEQGLAAARDAGINDGAGGTDPLERAIAATHRNRATPDRTLSPDQKAAVIVRLMQQGDLPLSLNGFQSQDTVKLVRALAGLHYVHEQTILAVMADFLEALQHPGLRFDPGLEGAIETLGDEISPDLKETILQTKPPEPPADAWPHIQSLPLDLLQELLATQTPLVTSIVLAKLPATTAAELLDTMDDDRALAVSTAAVNIGDLTAARLRQIGDALVTLTTGTDSRSALPGAPTERVASILNYTPGPRRESLLNALEREDAAAAEKIRQTMFTFADIPDRLEIKDIPKMVREVDNDTMVKALAAAQVIYKDSVEFILGNLSKRLSEQLRDSVSEVGEVGQKDGDKAMNAVIVAIRTLEDTGEITLITPET